MPEWLKKLLSVFKPEFNFNLLKTGKVEVHIHVTSAPSSPPTVEYDPQTGAIEVNVAHATPEQLAAAKELLRLALEKEGNTFIEAQAEQTVEDIKRLEGDAANRRILEALRDHITPEDFLALRSGLFVRDRFVKKMSVIELKEQILRTFGPRGTKIADICSAGHIDEIVEELQNAKAQGRFSPEKFRQAFNLFVEESAFAIFVKPTDSPVRFDRMLREKILRNSSYGIYRVYIHGIGVENVTKIRRRVDSLLEAQPSITKVSEQQIGDAVHMQLSFPQDIDESLEV